MDEIDKEKSPSSVEKRLPKGTPDLSSSKRKSAFEKFNSPLHSLKKTPKPSTDKIKNKDGIGVSESPVCKDLFPRFEQVENGVKDSKEPYHS